MEQVFPYESLGQERGRVKRSFGVLFLNNQHKINISKDSFRGAKLGALQTKELNQNYSHTSVTTNIINE